MVAFPAATGGSDGESSTFTITDMIHHLVPEARVLQHDIINFDKAVQPPDLDSDDEGDEIGELHSGESERKDVNSVPVPTTITSTSDAVDEGEKIGRRNIEINKVGSMGTIAFKTIQATAIETEESASVDSVVNHPFSPASFEQEALKLLTTIQRGLL